MPLEVLDLRSSEGPIDLADRHGGWDRPALARAARAVRDIVGDVGERGDEALTELTQRFDGALLSPDRFRVTVAERDEAAATVDERVRGALAHAADNIRAYHEAQRPKDWTLDREGAVVGQVFRPIGRVGLYAPGWRAPLPSTVLMLAVPAKVAGVPELALCTPPTADADCEPTIMAAAQVVGIEEIYRIGGAQAIAAMAYGTDTVPACDKVCGPGSVYTTLAKREVFGHVGIDGLFGPSESVVVADERAKPSFAAAELLVQAEHGPDASAVLVTTSEELLGSCLRELEARMARLPRAKDIRDALASHGLAILVRDLDQATEVVNTLAPEHLCLQVADPDAFLSSVTAAGAVLMGDDSPATLSDYCAGPSHVLPTARTAKYQSGIGVRDFLVAINTIRYDRKALFREASIADILAEAEGLQAHREGLHVRLEGP